MSDYVTTGDGTITMRDAETGELYHNRAGAFTEALQNYIEPSDALNRLRRQHQIAVLDVCFGLGYNTLVLLQAAIEARLHGFIEVVAIENDERIIAATKDVLQSERFAQLRTFLGTDEFACKFRQISATFGGLQISLNLRKQDVRQEVPRLSHACDFIFHDPFSPRKVPELWTLELFREYHRLLNQREGAVLTYSSSSAVRGGLRAAGFRVYKTAAVGEKKGGTLASISPLSVLPASVHDLSDEDNSKLSGKSAIPYRDDGFSRSRAEIMRVREAEHSN